MKVQLYLLIDSSKLSVRHQTLTYITNITVQKVRRQRKEIMVRNTIGAQKEKAVQKIGTGLNIRLRSGFYGLPQNKHVPTYFILPHRDLSKT